MNKNVRRKWNQEAWDGIIEMREDRTAPVDTMGCDKIILSDNDRCQRFCHLLACFLSSKTTDQSTAACMYRLKEKDLLSPENIIKLSADDLASVLRGVAFHNQKAKNLLSISKIVLEKGDVPDQLEDLLALPGIGLKMALLILQAAWGRTEGIAVDTHVHRISNRIGLVDCKTPDQTAAALKLVVPIDIWPLFNHMLVGFGQQRCTPVNPSCHVCLIKNFCEFGQSRSKRIRFE